MASPRDKYDSRMSVASETNTLADSFYAESGTSAAQRKAAAKQQVWKIWFKLFLAVVFPLAAFITLTMLLVLPQSEEASVARKMNLNLQYAPSPSGLHGIVILKGSSGREITDTWHVCVVDVIQPPNCQDLVMDKIGIRCATTYRRQLHWGEPCFNRSPCACIYFAQY